jgi:hypothetical protein
MFPELDARRVTLDIFESGTPSLTRSMEHHHIPLVVLRSTLVLSSHPPTTRYLFLSVNVYFVDVEFYDPCPGCQTRTFSWHTLVQEPLCRKCNTWSR